jgi:hypothetical protein
VNRWLTRLVLLATAAWLAGCTSLFGGEGRRVAQAESGCAHFSSWVPIPVRYMNTDSHELYLGCGKYVLVRCVSSTVAEACQVLEIEDAAKVLASDSVYPAPL